MPLMGLSSVRSLLSLRGGGYWVHRRASRPACFQPNRGAVLADRYLRSYGTLPRPFSLETISPSEFLRLDRSSRLSAVATTYQGLCPLRDITLKRPLLARGPISSLRSVLRRSQPPDGLLRSRARELVSSHSRVQGSSRSGVLPLCTASLPHQEQMPPCRWSKARSPTNRLPRPTLLDFEALFHAESRAASSAVRPRLRPLPSSGFLLLQVPSWPRPPVPQRPPLLAFPARAFDRANAIARPDAPPPAS